MAAARLPSSGAAAQPTRLPSRRRVAPRLSISRLYIHTYMHACMHTYVRRYIDIYLPGMLRPSDRPMAPICPRHARPASRRADRSSSRAALSAMRGAWCATNAAIRLDLSGAWIFAGNLDGNLR